MDTGKGEVIPEGPSPIPRACPDLKVEKLAEKIQLLKQRSLKVLMMQILASRFKGIGPGSGEYGPKISPLDTLQG